MIAVVTAPPIVMVINDLNKDRLVEDGRLRYCSMNIIGSISTAVIQKNTDNAPSPPAISSRTDG